MDGRTRTAVPASTTADRPLAGVVLLLLALFLFLANDGVAKHLTGSLSAQQIIWTRYALILALIAPVLWYRRGEAPLRTRHPFLHGLRGLMQMSTSLLFIVALARLPLEVCTAIGFVSPLFVTALSVPVLGERVGIRRWAAVGFGFLGVLVILRPATPAFEWTMLLPIASSFFWASSLVVTRYMRSTERPLTVLTYSTVVGCIASAPLALPGWQSPTGGEWLLLLAIGMLNAVGQYCVIRAFMLTSASFLAPFSYSTIVWAVLIGFFFFGTLPDAWTVAGTASLILAGLYVWHRERVRLTEGAAG